MKTINKLQHIIFFTVFLLTPVNFLRSQTLSSKSTMEDMILANNYFLNKWPNPGTITFTESNNPVAWAPSVYFDGLMALYNLQHDTTSLKYVMRWAMIHKWNLPGGIKTRNASAQSYGQTYIDLYLLDRYREERIKNVRACIDTMIAGNKFDDWVQVEQLEMAMPVFARLSAIYHDKRYSERLNEMYLFTKLKLGTNGLYNTSDHFWIRRSGDQKTYQAIPNGMVVSALVRTMDFLPGNREYETTLKDMFESLIPLQRSDGLWNENLKDSTLSAKKSISGSALLVYGLAWGINNGLINKKQYLPIVEKSWNALIAETVHPDGFNASSLSVEGQSADESYPEDFGVGCFLLAGSEIYKLAKSMEPKEKEPKQVKPKADTTNINEHRKNVKTNSKYNRHEKNFMY